MQVSYVGMPVRWGHGAWRGWAQLGCAPVRPALLLTTGVSRTVGTPLATAYGTYTPFTRLTRDTWHSCLTFAFVGVRVPV